MSCKSPIFFILCLLIIPELSFSQDFTLYLTGNKNDTITAPLGGICMMGGRRENNEAMKWFLNRANGGDIVILRASGSDGYNEYLFSELNMELNSVTSIVFHNRNASYNDTILQLVDNAEAIWMAGGNQWNYVQFWRDSPIDSIINHNIIYKNIAIGGTSAGMAVLGDYYFLASAGTVTSEECLSNPVTDKITVDTTPFFNLPILSHVITDTHYEERNREGRHMTFLLRIWTDFNQQSNGIACDEYTSLCIDNHGLARAYGNYPERDDHVYFLKFNKLPSTAIFEDTPLKSRIDKSSLKVYKLPGTNDGSYSFNLNNWMEGIGGEWFLWEIDNGSLIMKKTP